MKNTLVRPLFDGPIDIVGDVHGEIDALLSLLHHLGYPESGAHPQQRRLVFVGDLTDRGPNSPAVVTLVRHLVEQGRAQCILGNHEVNILLGQQKHGSGWLYGKPESLDRSGAIISQALADEPTKANTLAFFAALPLALERDDVRIVHACWRSDTIELVRHETDAVRVLEDFKRMIADDLNQQGVEDDVDRRLAHQNRNLIKLLTSGPERRVKRFYAAGKDREEGREPWWNNYQDALFCIFGHYWRTRLPNDSDGDHVFDDSRPHAALGNGNAMCIDYSVGKRWQERRAPGFQGTFATRLAAMRFPEKLLVLDDGRSVPVA